MIRFWVMQSLNLTIRENQVQNSVKRLDYIDALKGFAILLVVMGHVLACNYSNFREALASNVQGVMLWKIIYSFHMPLFMFCSGFVFHKSKDFFSTKNTLTLIFRRFKGLIIPYISMGFISFLLIDRFFIYWYLYCLFVFYAITVVFEWTMFHFKWWTIRIDSLFLLATSFLFLLLHGKFSQFEWLPLIDLGHFSLYFYFILGMIVRRHELHNFIQSHNIFFSISIVLFFGFTLANFHGISFPLSGLFYLLIPLSAISCLLFFFQANQNKGKIFPLLQKCGNSTLEIYVLHVFFYISIPWGGALDLLPCKMSFVLQLVTSFFSSAIMIAICIAITNFVSKSSLLKMILFGK